MSLIRRYSSKLQFVITATVMGNLLQWFDFSLFGLMLPIFLKLFFPNTASSFLLVLYACGALARPVGGIVFGYIGDTLGRKYALIKTILFMTIPILLVACLPSYKQIGITASILLGAIYCFQGFCIGGEFPGSVVFLCESAPPKQRGYVGSWAYFGVALGLFLVSFDIFELELNLPTQVLLDWGWRIPFFIGAFVGAIGFFMRHFLHETPIFQEAKAVGHLVHKPLFDTVHKHKKMLLIAIGIFVLDAVAFNLIIIFSNFYYTEYFGLTLRESFKLNVFVVFLFLILMPILGKIGNHVGNIRFAKGSAWAMLLLVFPLYLLIAQKTLLCFYLGQGALAIILAAYLCNMPGIVYDLFPTPVRYTCVACAINFSVALFGGTAPFIVQKLIGMSGFTLLPSLYLMVGALISLLCLSTLKRAQLS
ncbi:MAG TPA: MFS transporter [Chlamydiales bacterium]|nr:MFS transporter [Chlamydiales bacterium]